uniref:tRNA(Phe) 7-((3-amino-3-carboxypropyl)-4-demethylwyosine(37)-N(4))-methyltransferase n=1 Tax=Thermosphaera aggregans TaxID=54254 RepID=A0A7C2FPY2_9CREN
MKFDIESWRKRKKSFWERILEDLEIGYLDKDLLPLLILLNLDARIYTMSSCSGRITLVDGDNPWSRDDTSVVFKKHIPIALDELLSIYQAKIDKKLWIIVTGPIIHLSSSQISLALRILDKARREGYKHSGIMHLSRSKGVLLELSTGIWVSQLLRTAEKTIVAEEDLNLIVDEYNRMLLEGKKRLDRLYNSLKQIIPGEVDYEVGERVSKELTYLENKTPLQVFYELAGISRKP